MKKKKLSEAEKKEIIKSILGANHSATGQHFQLFSEMITGLGYVNDAASFAELLPALSSWLSGARVSTITSTASFAGVLLFPLQQLINLINANETGLRFYSYRAISYTITAWAFDKPRPLSSPQIMFNVRNGPYTEVQGKSRYGQVWQETAFSVTNKIKQTCLQKKINEKNMKTIFKALSKGKPESLSLLILQGFENEFSHITKGMWKSNYNVLYPQ